MKLPGSHLPPASRQLGRGGGRTRQRLGSVGAVRPGVIAGRGLVHCRGKTEPPRILLEGGRLQRSMWHLAQVGRDKPELPRGHPIMCRSLSHPALASFLPSPGWGPVLGVGLVYKNLSWMRPAPEGGGVRQAPCLEKESEMVKRMLSRSLVLDRGKFPHPPGDSWQGGRHQPVERGKPASRGWRPGMLGAAPPYYPVPPVEPGVGGGPGIEQRC